MDPTTPDAPADTVIEAPPFHGPVVGIGASAGGLDALERLFGALPVDTGACFIVIQHLAPDRKSMMDNLLARYTAMPVRMAEHGQPLQANAVFLIPPAKTMRLAGERLLLDPKPEQGLSLPIDVFLGSLAEQCADRAVAVILSGTGSDGSRGLPAVNAAGGFVFVQEPSTARFDGMPRSAIGTGLADVVAPVEELAKRLTEHLHTPRSGLRGPGGAGLAAPLDHILELLLAGSGIDFRDYKPNTVLRRIERRMQVLRQNTLADYAGLLAAQPAELVLLRRELLIPVTRFFRDVEAFEHLAEAVVTPLVAAGDRGAEPVRVWVACCATGEEAYTVAVLFAEAMHRLGVSRTVKIFATDVEGSYLDSAGTGQYPDTIAAEVSGERLERWFVERQGGWAVRPEIRHQVIFARHNLMADPPFTRMDLVICRNALIYFQPAAQERALRRLQYALAPGGHLMLGPSESLGVLHRDFTALPGAGKIHRLVRRDRLPLRPDPSRHLLASQRERGARQRAEFAPEAALGTAALRQLQQTYLPPTLLVGPGRELLHVWGNARALLNLREGEATLDVLRLLPAELARPVSVLLQACEAEPELRTTVRVRLAAEEAPRTMQLVGRRLLADGGDGGDGSAGATLLSFEPAVEEALPALDAARLDAEQLRRIDVLERELELTHENLQATIEELEAANEELQATNEELMASNEELQSTNEELQSVNEELYTVNAEYQEKVDVLNSVNADLENIARATATPTLFIDEQLRLMRFTPEAMALFKVRDGDRGRPLDDFAHRLDYPELFAELQQTMVTQVAREREVRSHDGQWWLARLQPYAGAEPGSARAVMNLVNISSLKDSERTQAILDSLAAHVAVLDVHGTIVRVNAAWRRFAADNGDAELRSCGPGANYLQACVLAAVEDPGARRAYEGVRGVLEGRLPQFSLRYPCDSQGRRLWFLMHVSPVQHPSGGAVVSHVDITAALAEPTEAAS